MMLSPGFSMVSAHCPLPPPSPARAHVGEEWDQCWVLFSQPPPQLPPHLPGQGDPDIWAPVPLQLLSLVGRSPGSHSGAFLCPGWAAARGIWGWRQHKLQGACNFAECSVAWGGGTTTHALGAHAQGC